MSLIVQKYGGTSVGSTERIRNVAKRVARFHAQGHQIVVVVSAMSGETNRLLALAKELSHESRSARGRRRRGDRRAGDDRPARDRAARNGAQGAQLHGRAGAHPHRQRAYEGAHPRDRRASACGSDLAEGTIVVVAGFQGVDKHGNVTTLGRGGSDTSGVALAAALKADECQIYTDVDGVYTTDPRIVPEARRLERITFEEMLELASQGSKVLQIRSVEFAGKYMVRLRVLSSFEDADATSTGTLITYEEDDDMEQAIISGIAFNRDEAKISVMGVEDRPGIAYAILGPIAAANIDVDMIVQNIGASGHTDFSFTVNRNEYQKALAVLERRAREEAHRGARSHRRQPNRQGVGRRHRHALARRPRVEDVQGAGRRGDQHPDDLDVGDQDRRRHRREVPRARRARAAQGVRAREGAESTRLDLIPRPDGAGYAQTCKITRFASDASK